MDFANYGSASNLEDELAELMESALPGARSSLEVRLVRLASSRIPPFCSVSSLLIYCRGIS
jgi:hypothetical protein